jgi:crossover junction endodeoxyribonuclease RusA
MPRVAIRKPRPHERYTAVQPYLLAKFTVIGEPIAKARPRWTGRGQTYTPRPTRDGEAHIQDCCFVADPTLRPKLGLIFLRVEFHMAGLGRADLDNMLKLVADALNGIAWHDDRQITRTHAEIFMFSDRPRTEVEVWLVGIPA